MKVLWLFLGLSILLGGRTEGPVGQWRTTLELSGEINAALEEQGLGEYLHVSTFPVVMTMTFRENGTYSCQADGEAFGEAVENLKEEMRVGFTAYTREKLEESGVDMEVAEVFDAMGTSLDEMLDRAFELEHLTGLSAGEEAGRYAWVENKLFFSGGMESKIDWSCWDEFSLEEDRLTFTAAQGVPNAAFSPEEYPIRFDKVG